MYRATWFGNDKFRDEAEDQVEDDVQAHLV
jgi:hypothetical protein